MTCLNAFITYNIWTMKKKHFKRIVAIFWLAINFNLATQAFTLGEEKPLPLGTPTLSAGDIVIIGLHTNTQDEFAWMPLVDLPAGEVVYFTSAGYINGAFSSTTSSLIKYVTPAGGLPAGTIMVVHDDCSNGSFDCDTEGDYSMIEGTDLGNRSDINLLATGDQILVFQSSDAEDSEFTEASFVPIFAVTAHSTNWIDNSSELANSTALYPGLTDGVNAVAAGAGPGSSDEFNNIRYEGTLTGSKEQIMEAVADVDNWFKTDTEGSAGWTKDGKRVRLPVTPSLVQPAEPSVSVPSQLSASATASIICSLEPIRVPS